jgi:electron transport complex protein RnfE
MSSINYKKIITDGLWTNNQGLVALLGLCPLMAVTSTTINGLGLGLATLLTLVLTNVIVAAISPWIRNEIRIPMFVLIIASVVTAIELLMSAHLYELYRILGIFVPLIVTNCAVIGRAEAFASKHSISRAFADGFSMGLGFCLVLVLLGMLREVIGYGTLFRQAHLMFGEPFRHVSIDVFSQYDGFLLAILPPGAFMGLALLIAIKNRIDRMAMESRSHRRIPIQLEMGEGKVG